MSSFKFGEMCICDECKNQFFVMEKDAWVYKKRINNKKFMFCSYGCMRKWEKSQNEKVVRRRKVSK